MIVASGQIGHKSILDEFGRSTSSNSLHQIVRFFNGKKQVLINSEWVDCNMCSLYLPSHIAPHSIKDWYSYNHSATGVTGGTITGTTTVDANVAYTYGVSLTGGNTTGVTVVWYKFENNAWSNSIGTGPTISITWVNPIGAKVKAIIINGCQGGTVEIEQPITYNCTNITSGSLQSVNSMQVNTIFTAYQIDSNGSELGKTWLWEVFGNLQILAGQGTKSCVIKATAAGGINIIRVTVTNTCNSYTPGDVSLTISGAPTVYWNTQQAKSIQKQCASGQIGTFYTVVVQPNTYSSTSSVADANQQAIDYLNSQYAQNIANIYGSCITEGGGQEWFNQEQVLSFSKECTSGYGTSVNYVVAAGAFSSTVSQADANQKAINFINEIPSGETKSRGQLNANANGQCVTNPIYYSTERSGSMQKTCPPGAIGSFVPYQTFAGQFQSTISVADANAQRDIWIANYVEQNGGCQSGPVYWNTEISAYFTKQCASGVGSSHYYTIAGSTYSSTVSQQAAQALAQAALDQQGQANANNIGSCTVVGGNGNPDYVNVNIYTQVYGASGNPTRVQIINFNGSNKAVTVSYRPYTGFNLGWFSLGTVSEGSTSVIDPGVAYNVGIVFEIRLQFSGESVQYFSTSTVFEANV